MRCRDEILLPWFLFRKLLGAIVVLYCVLLLPDFSTLVSTTGVWPCNLGGRQYPLWNSIDPLCSLGGDYSVLLERLVFVVLFFAGLVGVSGRGSPLTSTVTWLCILTLHHRAPMILDGGDGLLRLLLFLSVLVPSRTGGVRQSTSEVPIREDMISTRIAFLTVLHRIVLATMYTVAGIAKYGAAWRDGSACELVSRDPEFAFTWFPGILALVPELMHRAGCIAIPWFELLGGLVMLSSLVSSISLKGIAVALGLLHVAIFAFLRLELFPLVCLVGLVPLMASTREAPLLLLWRSSRRTVAAVVVWISLFVFGAVQTDVQLEEQHHAPSVVRTLGALGFVQTWRLFAPAPRSSHCYRELLLYTRSGNVSSETIYVSSRQASHPLDEIRSRLRWRHFLASLNPLGMFPLRKQFSSVICTTPTQDQAIAGTLVCSDPSSKRATRSWLWSVSCDPTRP